MAVVVVEHRLELLHAVAETVLVMDAGKVIAEGPPARRVRRPCRPRCVLRGAQGRMTHVLEVRGLSAGYGPLRVLHDIDLAVAAGRARRPRRPERAREDDAPALDHGPRRLAPGRDRARREVDHADAGAQAGTGGGRADAPGRRALPGPVGQGQPRLGRRSRPAGASGSSGASGCCSSSLASPTVSARPPARSPEASGGCARSGEASCRTLAST